MANTLTSILPTILTRAQAVLRKRVLMPRLINSDFQAQMVKPGSTVNVVIPDSTGSASDVVPGPTPPAPTGKTPTTVPIALNNWKKSNFALTDQDYTQIEAEETFIPGQLNDAVRQLAEQVNGDLFALAEQVWGYVGTAGTTPFASDVLAALALRKQLNIQKCWKENRRCMLDFAADANALAQPQFSDLQTTGDTSVKIEGEIGRKFGMDFYADDQVPTHTAGTITTGMIAKASTAQAIGLATIVGTTAASTGACALLKGDIIAISGSTQTYVLTANATQASAATDVNLAISPPLVKALVGSETITVKATHVMNLGFHRDAFAFANRPFLEDRATRTKRNTFQMQDRVTGIWMRVELIDEYKQTAWELDILYGQALVRPELAVRLAG